MSAEMSNDQMDPITSKPFVSQDLPFNNVMPMVKIDVRSYPEFDGTLKNWKGYKQKFKSIASMHNIGDLISSTYQIPVEPKDI